MTTPDSETRIRVLKFPMARIFLEPHLAKSAAAPASDRLEDFFVRPGISERALESFCQRLAHHAHGEKAAGRHRFGPTSQLN
jgi:hypothetical protein